MSSIGKRARRTARRALNVRSPLMKVLIGTGRGTMVGAYRGSRRVVDIAMDRHRRYRSAKKFSEGHEPESGEVAARVNARRLLRPLYTCAPCKRSFLDPNDVALHYEAVHSEEDFALKRRPLGKLRKNLAGPNAGKLSVTVPAPSSTGGRHRPTKGTRRVSAAEIIKANKIKLSTEAKDQMEKVGKRAMSDSEPVKNLVSAAHGVQDIRVRRLSEIENLLGGTASGLRILADSFRSFRTAMHHRGYQMDSTLNIANAADALEDAGGKFQQALLVLQEDLAQDIRAARERRAQERPDDDDLLS